jgi:16S rRNA (adenine1518-N6/adenine1519-N6)-dimethyltransferase
MSPPRAARPAGRVMSAPRPGTQSAARLSGATSTGARPASAPTLDEAAIRRLLREANLRARHSLSQNFLTDVDVLGAILAEANPAAGDRVLEIGPGLGVLTGALLDAGAAVTAVELDAGLSALLRRTFAGQMARGQTEPGAPGTLVLVEGDVLDQDLGALVAAPFDVVANLPYHITSPILHRLLGLERPPRRLVLMVQREVAERIAAPPGGMSYLSVFVQYHARVRVAVAVPSAAFEPEPNVDSAVVVIEPYERGTPDRLDPDDEDQLWRLVQASFRERRKMLHNVLARQLPIGAARVADALAAAGIDPDRRPQTLDVDDWLRLRMAIGPIAADHRGRREASPSQERRAAAAAADSDSDA